jgi:hypothetical protein
LIVHLWRSLTFANSRKPPIICTREVKSPQRGESLILRNGAVFTRNHVPASVEIEDHAEGAVCPRPQGHRPPLLWLDDDVGVMLPATGLADPNHQISQRVGMRGDRRA